MKLAKLSLGLILSAGLVLSGCRSKKDNEDLLIPAHELYEKGLNLLSKNKHSDAAEEFANIFLSYPGDEITPQAELMQAYSLFLDGTYEEAIDVLDTFIRLHPMNIDIAYAHYLKALSYYMQISNVYLDQSRTALAKDAFEEVIRRFPGTKYATDSALKIDLVNDHLAGKEMEVGRYYLSKKNPIPAIKRFQSVIDNYQTTSHTAEALYRLVVSYVSLGLIEEAKKYAAVLGANYPESLWYKHSYHILHALK